MRFNEFTTIYESLLDENELQEARDGNKQTRYCSEIGLLAGFCGVDPTTFDPSNPEASFPKGSVTDTVIKEIKKFLVPNFNPKMFAAWHAKGAPFMTKMGNKLGKVPKKFDWAGGSNQNAEGAADIEFLDSHVHGLSVKAETGITLSNLTPKALGLDVARGNDIFFQYAGDEYMAMKTKIFNAVMDLAEQNPGKALGWHSEHPDKYSITYHPRQGDAGANAAGAANAATPVATPRPSPFKKQAPKAGAAGGTAGAQPDPLADIRKNAGILQAPIHQSKSKPKKMAPDQDQYEYGDDLMEAAEGLPGTFTITGKKNFSGDRAAVLAQIGVNKAWQRVFGDWFQANYAANKQMAAPLYKAVAGVFKDTIVNHLAKDRKLDAILRMNKTPYFYCNDKDVYYVPSINEVSDLRVKDVHYGAMDASGKVNEAEGTSQKFQALVGRPDSEQNAKILIYIRYANGMFEANPTVRVQDLRDAQFLGWELL